MIGFVLMDDKQAVQASPGKTDTIFGGRKMATDCPICGESVETRELRRHINSDEQEIRNYTLDLIKSSHADWVEENGACPKCWEYYKSLGSLIQYAKR